MLTLSDWIARLRACRKREEGQTQAEYGVVLTVITVASVGVFTALSGGLEGAVSRAIGLLPK